MQPEQTLNEVLNKLSVALGEEKAALLSSNYDALSRCARIKQALVERLDGMLLEQKYASALPAYRKRIAGVIQAAEENERLLQTAKVGVAMAHTRIRTMLNRQRDVGVYCESGDKLLAADAGITRQKLA